MEFRALFVNLSIDENDVIIIGFLENNNYNNFLTIQYYSELDEQDVRLGWTKYYIEVNQFGGSYGCIETVYWTNNSIFFVFNDIGIKQFNSREVKIYFELSTEDWIRLDAALKIIFDETIGDVSN